MTRLLRSSHINFVPPQGGCLKIQETGMIESVQKSKPKKSLGLPTRPKNNPWIKYQPPKKPIPNFRAQVWLHLSRWTTRPRIFRLFWIPKKSLLSQIFLPQKILWSSPLPKIQSTSPWVCAMISEVLFSLNVAGRGLKWGRT